MSLQFLLQSTPLHKIEINMKKLLKIILIIIISIPQHGLRFSYAATDALRPSAYQNTVIPPESAASDSAIPYYDILVTGGGIVGAGVARELALRGISVLLCEKTRFAAGASSKSTRLIHAGIRYLEVAYAQAKKGKPRSALENFSFVLKASRERRRIQHIAPDLVTNIPILIPIYKSSKRNFTFVRIGVWLYFALSWLTGGNLPRPECLHVNELIKRFPKLDRKGLIGGFIYYDTLTDDRKLVLANINDAIEHGADARENHEVISYSQVTEDGESYYLVTLKDHATGREFQAKAKKLVNATGAWIDRVRERGDLKKDDNLLEPTRGAHIDLGRQPMPTSLVVEGEGGRIVFVINRPDGTARAGTTKAPWDDPDNVEATDDEIDYIIDAVNTILPGDHVTRDDVINADAGVRPLVAQPGITDSDDLSRKHKVIVDEDGLINVCGVKLTDYRWACEEVFMMLAQAITPGAKPKRISHKIPFTRNAILAALKGEVLAKAASAGKSLTERILTAVDRLREDSSFIEGASLAQIARRLRISKDNIPALKRALRDLVRDGRLSSYAKGIAFGKNQRRHWDAERFFLSMPELEKRRFSRKKAKMIAGDRGRLRQFAVSLTLLFDDRLNPTIYDAIQAFRVVLKPYFDDETADMIERLSSIVHRVRRANPAYQAVSRARAMGRMEELEADIVDSCILDTCQMMQEALVLIEAIRRQSFPELDTIADAKARDHLQKCKEKLEVGHAQIASAVDLYSAIAEGAGNESHGHLIDQPAAESLRHALPKLAAINSAA